MKTSLVTYILIGVCAILLVPQGAVAEPTMPKAAYILPQEVKRWRAEEFPHVLVDVREKEEYDAGHIDGAINIPYAQVEERLEEFDRTTPYVFTCIHSSWRAPYVANLLLDHGYENVLVLDGGVSAWNAGGQVIMPSQANTDDTVPIAPYPKKLAKDLTHPPAREYTVKINLTEEQLAEFDGRDGRPAFVAVDGVIYDLTASRLWRGGIHDPGHGDVTAGKDLTHLMKDAPHGLDNLKRYPVVGQLIAE